MGTTIKWGIMVPFDNQYLWVTTGNAFNTRPLLFNTKEAAYQTVKSWGPGAIVKQYDVKNS